MRKFLVSMLTIVALLLPANIHAQSGDATWLDNVDGLDLAIGRSWMAPVDFTQESTLTGHNAEATAVSETTSRSTPASTPVITDEIQTMMLSALIFQFDSSENAADGLELFNREQLDQISSDPRSPATNTFSPKDLGDTSYGHEGLYEVENPSGDSTEFAVVYLLVQQESLVYQVFGQFLPGNHVEIATQVAEDMISIDTSDAEPMYDMNGGSTGGLWEKLNAVEITLPIDASMFDLEIYPPADDAVMGDSVVVPVIDLENLAEVPGITDSWHIAYGPEGSATPMATPAEGPPGVFNIELWVMDFSDPTNASAAAISLGNTLIEPLGIISSEGGGFGSNDEHGMTIVNSGFVRDRSLPAGDAAVVIQVRGSAVYAARVYASEAAPTPIAKDLVTMLVDTPASDSPEKVDGLSANGGTWAKFPQSGDPLLHGLIPISVRHNELNLAPATPATHRKHLILRAA